MSMTRPPYPSEFREQMVELVRSGRSPEELARGIRGEENGVVRCGAGSERGGLEYAFIHFH